MQKDIPVTFDIPERLALPLAQFLKRVGFSECRQCAATEAEAYAMRDALFYIREALADAGYSQR